jgi:alpha-beta hydrolase superfamily lysophospholipase
MTSSLHIPSGKYDWLQAYYEQTTELGTETGLSRKSLVIMVHGFPGEDSHSHEDIYGQLSYTLTKDGFDTIRFDFRGCGKSEGKQKDFNFQNARQDIKAVYEWAEQAGYKSFAIIASGFGACIALLEQHEKMSACILLWPMLMPNSSWLGDYTEKVSDDKWKDRDYLLIGENRVGKTFLAQIKECNMSKYIQNIDVPVLVQHGVMDKKIPIEQLEELREHAKTAKRIEITSYEAGNFALTRPNERKTMFHHIRQFLHKYA